ncbi:hypothetical protein Back2_21040 [Nocardioides baekrokdamisoli]|uniref:Uncharacterized protein n=1 Tax=Nocardioides baekrokdamisoli TaxID=1804624 RepID=A0A3G9IFS1_9ACTN|nr:hypothetical protein [Nocardioides baekrokdamisoli]BBH17817.1 hypothetical protein Back2_21040 [Nocardioides baekrokdamisoli]
MGDVLRQLELNKLARILAVEPSSLDVLLASDPDDIRELRTIVTERLFSLHGGRVAALAQLSKKVPAAISAKMAEAAFGPVLSARIAGALDPADAAKMSALLSPEFLAQVSRDVDPARVASIIKLLPDDLIIKVGRILLREHDTIALARFVASVSPAVVTAVLEGADGNELLELALYVDDRAALDSIIAEFSDERLSAVLAATKGFHGATDKEMADAAVALVAALTPATRARWSTFADQAPPAVAKAVTAAVAASR